MMEMKNIIKKIASIAMAFTLLGTGTAVTKTISPNYGSTLTASSANSVSSSAAFNPSSSEKSGFA